jgi:hypothetical protein
MDAPALILPTQAAVVRFGFARRGQPRPPRLPDGRFPLAPAIDTPIKKAAGQPARDVRGRQAWAAGTLVRADIDQVIVILRDPAFDQDFGNPPGTVALQGCPPNFGTDPNDPAGFSPSVDPGSAACQMLSAYAMANCFSRGRYF